MKCFAIFQSDLHLSGPATNGRCSGCFGMTVMLTDIVREEVAMMIGVSSEINNPGVKLRDLNNFLVMPTEGTSQTRACGGGWKN